MGENPPIHLIIINEITSTAALAHPCAVIERVEEPGIEAVASITASEAVAGPKPAESGAPIEGVALIVG